MKRMLILPLALLVGIPLAAIFGGGDPSPMVSTLPDTVAIGLVAPPTSAIVEIATTPVPSTTEVEIQGSASVVDTAVRIEPPTTTIPAPTTTVLTWERYNCLSFVPLLEKHPILPVDWSLRIMQRESHCDPDVRCNKWEPCRSPVDDSLGLFQINTKGYLWTNPGGIPDLCGIEYREQLFDPETNIACAAQLYAARGKAPWGT